MFIRYQLSLWLLLCASLFACQPLDDSESTGGAEAVNDLAGSEADASGGAQEDLAAGRSASGGAQEGLAAGRSASGGMAADTAGDTATSGGTTPDESGGLSSSESDCEAVGATCRADGQCQDGETRVRSECALDGAACCLPEEGQDLCADWYYQVCFENSDCDAGYRCGTPSEGCTASSCICDPETGEAGPCTRDCRRNVGLCEPCPASGCDDTDPPSGGSSATGGESAGGGGSDQAGGHGSTPDAGGSGVPIGGSATLPTGGQPDEDACARAGAICRSQGDCLDNERVIRTACDADGAVCCLAADQRCNSNQECPAGQRCDSGGCLPCTCPTDITPVCGADDVTYNNRCEASCAGEQVAYEGSCREPIDCSEAGFCARNGAWCEDGDEPECWAGDSPVCFTVDHPTSQERCDRPDCSDAGFCARNGAWCEAGDRPECWIGDDPVCFTVEHPTSQARCDQPDCSDAGYCARNGAWCESGDQPECWVGENPVCFLPNQPISIENCSAVDCTNAGACNANGAWCEAEDRPECFEGDQAVCFTVDHPYSLDRCGARDCSDAGLCARNGAWCEAGDRPECWEGANPVCFRPDHAISLERCDAPDCSDAGFCARNGAWCEAGDRPECWAGTAPVCFTPDHPISLERCEAPDCSDAGSCARNGGWCEDLDRPECWAGDAPVCFLPDQAVSIARCGNICRDDTDGDGTCDALDDLCNVDDEQLACRQLPPTCPDGQVPELQGGCYGECVSWTDCQQDNSCTSGADCAPGFGCEAGVCVPCSCPENYDPVCGSDGATYGNQCEADCAQVEVARPGPCLEFCGGFAGLQCADPTHVCVDIPDDGCAPPLGSDCMGTCQPPAGSGCTDDNDCTAGNWCRATDEDGVRACVSYQTEGESCGGFVLPWTLERCQPDLRCAQVNPMIPDPPGVCRAPCQSDNDCSRNQYCAGDGVCRPDGSCLNDVDCNAAGNGYAHVECVGSGICDMATSGGTCGWECASDDLCEDFYHQVCTANDDCMAGYQCGAANEDCTPSSCGCDPSTGISVCTDDCNLGARLCEPCPETGCVRPEPTDCSEAGYCEGNGSWCETGNDPACWVGTAPVCLIPTHPISLERCGTPGCTDDDECGRGQWCRVTEEEGISACTPYQAAGESCGGFVPPAFQTRCSPDLQCAPRTTMIADLPGICRVPCTANADCPGTSYCAADQVCRDDASCLVNADCNAEGNDYLHAQCVGVGTCGESDNGFDRVCGWSCRRDDGTELIPECPEGGRECP